MKKTTRLIAFVLFFAFVMLTIASCANGKQVTTTETSKTETTAVDTTVTEEITTTEETTTEETTTEEETTTDNHAVQEFDMNDVVLSFGLVSDVHIGDEGRKASIKFQSALNQLQNKADELGVNLDAIVSTGDLTNNGTTEQYNTFKSLYEKIMGTDVPFVFCLGNHDAYTPLSTAYNVFTTDTYRKTVVDSELQQYGDVHYVVNGIHFVSVCGASYSSSNFSVVFSPKTKTWLDDTLKQITEEDPDAPVFVLLHCMIYDTAYGSTLDVYTSCCWYTKELTDILSQYPQVITLSGHLHFTVNDERSIMQSNFTSIGCGSTCYMAVMNGGYQNMTSVTVMADANDISNGLLFLVDSKGAVRVVRMDFSNKSSVKEDWIIPAPAEDKSHLNFYRADRKDNDNTAPVFNDSNLIVLDDVVSNSKGYLPAFYWKAATDDDMVFLYEVSVSDSTGKVLDKWKVLSDYYRVIDAKDMKKEYKIQNRINGGRLSYEEEYTVTVVAYDCWENASKPVTLKFKGSLNADSEAEITIVSSSFVIE